MKFTMMLSVVLIFVGCFSNLQFTHAGVVGAWLFDEPEFGKVHTIVDATGNGHDGKIVGNAKRVKGQFGRALQFLAGTEENQPWGHVAIPHHEDMNLTEAFSLYAWVKVPNVIKPFWVNKGVAISQMIVSKAFDDSGSHADARNYAMWIQGSGGTPPVPAENEGHATGGYNALRPIWAQVFAKETRKVTDDTWHCVAVTFDRAAKELIVYVDGTEVGKASSGRKPGTVDTPLLIGAIDAKEGKRGVGRQGLDGIVDEVAVFDTALSAAEIKSIMEEGLADKYEEVRAVDRVGKLTTVWGKIKAER